LEPIQQNREKQTVTTTQREYKHTVRTACSKNIFNCANAFVGLIFSFQISLLQKIYQFRVRT
jgi:hypothetical protein